MSKEQTPAEPACRNRSRNRIRNIESMYLEKFNNWEDLEAKMDLLRGIYAIGFETPSPIQKKAISLRCSTKKMLSRKLSLEQEKQDVLL